MTFIVKQGETCFVLFADSGFFQAALPVPAVRHAALSSPAHEPQFLLSKPLSVIRGESPWLPHPQPLPSFPHSLLPPCTRLHPVRWRLLNLNETQMCCCLFLLYVKYVFCVFLNSRRQLLPEQLSQLQRSELPCRLGPHSSQHSSWTWPEIAGSKASSGAPQICG